MPPTCLQQAGLIEADVDLLEVQKILGHHSILTTARYTHLTAHTHHNASLPTAGRRTHQSVDE